MSTKQLTELLSQLLAAGQSILNGFVQMSRFLEHTLGFGIGYPVFGLLCVLAAFLPPIARWADMVKPRDGSKGISSAEASQQTGWHFLAALIICGAVNGYVYAHGGVLPPHP
ncbi:MAG TPA: hypothetical protein VF458_20355 [Ktedonobacteraceae bacterium]